MMSTVVTGLQKLRLINNQTRFISRYDSITSERLKSSITTPQQVPLIGLEVHVQLACTTKLFSRSPYQFGSPPNTLIDLFDTSIPGSMPIANRRAIELSVLACLALNARVNLVSRFERKHYFYADLPSGYQITQQSQPIGCDGYLEYVWTTNTPLPPSTAQRTVGQCVKSRARIKRIQIEQDTGKTLQDPTNNRCLVDLNRSGVALIELVTEPDFHHPSQAVAFVHNLASLLSFIGCSNADASRGELRVDVNVSIGPSSNQQGARVEVKNVNSLRGIAQAIEFEIDRQSAIVRSGNQVGPESRSFDPVTSTTQLMRDKEVARDYRYLPEPNLPLLRLASSCPVCQAPRVSSTQDTSSSTQVPDRSQRLCISCIRNQLQKKISQDVASELPPDKRIRLTLEHNLPLDKVEPIVEHQLSLGRLYEATLEQLALTDSGGVSLTQLRKELVYWLTGHLLGMLKSDASIRSLTSQRFAEFIKLTVTGNIYGRNASKLLTMLIENRNPTLSVHDLADESGYLALNDPVEIKRICQLLIYDNPKLVKLYHNGRQKQALRRLLSTLFVPNQSRQVNPLLAEREVTRLLDQLRS